MQVALGSDRQCLFQHVFHLGQMLAADLDLSFGGGHGPGEPVHLGLEQVEWYRPGVVRLHQGSTFLAELLQVDV